MSDNEQKWIDQLKHEHDLYKKHLKALEDENADLRDQVNKLEKACDMWMLEASKAHGIYYQNEKL